MKKGIYYSLAVNGIKKNKKLYFPYILTCTGTVMMCYIISFLSITPVFSNIRGGDTTQRFLSMGVGVMIVFSLIFLFYTNSFLIRRRKKEFGLYNILGVGKKNLAFVLFLEMLIIAGISIFTGLFFGILFSKFAELCMVKILSGTATFTFIIEFQSIIQTILLFIAIFILIYLNILRQIHLTNPIQLLNSENLGEKPPKANWLLAVLGVGILGIAYYIAVTIKDPVTAITAFFFAVIMVVIATYLIFIAGSVTLCRILQKNKHYYYKTNHFVSVSSMLYRMKRNGAGLASICILCTMVLVMVSSTVCLYIGKEDNLRNCYPRDISIDAVVGNIDMLNGRETEKTIKIAENVILSHKTKMKNIIQFRAASFGGVLHNEMILFDNSVYENRFDNISDICQIFIIPVSDYNTLMKKNEVLEEGEVLVNITKEINYNKKNIKIGDSRPLSVKKYVNDFAYIGGNSMQVFPTIYLFVPDFEAVVTPLGKYTLGDDGQQLISLHWYYAFDLICDNEAQIGIQEDLRNQISVMEEQLTEENSSFHAITEGIASERSSFYGLSGGLFFLGILLGIVFIFAAVLIIYYKQISEGYEDRSRFDIMQKVGITKREIKKSINSQILTVFFLPLFTAGVHLAFAFPLIRKLLMIFGLTNLSLLVITTIICYLIFTLFYIIIYRVTSRSYFTIVSGD